MALKPSKAYRQALVQAIVHHQDSKTYSGSLLRPHKTYLSELIERLQVKSALDFGAGKGVQYRWRDPADGMTLEEAWGFDVVKYDPAWEPFAAEPVGRFDLVICTHTLGSIPLRDHKWVIPKLIDHAGKALFIAEKIGPIKKGVHGLRDGFVNGWTRGEWVDHIRKFKQAWSGGPEIILSTTERVAGEKITERAQL